MQIFFIVVTHQMFQKEDTPEKTRMKILDAYITQTSILIWPLKCQARKEEVLYIFILNLM